MKLKAIKQICMNAGEIVIYSTPGGRQWIGTNEVCFLADESVKLTQDAIITIFELDDKKLEKVKINEMPLIESGMLPLHGWSEEAIMGEYMAVLEENGRRYKMLESKDHRLYIMDEEFIHGAVGQREYRRFALGYSADEQPLIIMSNGLIENCIAKPKGGKTTAEIQKHYRNLGFMQPGIPEKTWEETKEEEEQQTMVADLDDFEALSDFEGPPEEEYDDSISDS